MKKVDNLIAEEIDSWVNEGIISNEQAEKIKARYEVTERGITRTPSRLISAISTFGALLLGVGVILFFASNWKEMPKWGKLILIFISITASYRAGYWMRYERQNYPRVGKALIFLGSLLYGAGIWLIAQIYNIKEHYPNGILLWIIGVLPMAYMISSESILSLTLLLSTLWLGLEFMYAPTGGFNEFTAHEFIALYVIYGVFLYAIGLIQSQTRRFSNLKRPYLMLGAVIALLLFYPLTFETISRELSRSGQSVKKFSELWIGIPILTVLSFILIFVSIALKREKDKMFLAEAGGLLGVLFLALFTLLYPEVSLNYVVSNTIFILIILGVLALGYYKHIPSLVNVGSFFFGLEVVTRYFDWFWDLLPKSLFFIVGGVILLIGGIHLERRRRKVIESMRGYVGT